MSCIRYINLKKLFMNQYKSFFSFLLITYNQEKYVKDAFNACIEQTYRNYEIVICDDNSLDETFTILSHLTEEYKKEGGQVPIILHKNKQNKGIGGNFQQAAQLSHGEWFVMAAGDDISLPTRLETLSHIVTNHPNAYGINTARYFVDEHIDNLKYNFQRDYLLGADSAWHRSLFTDFIPLDKRVMSEDHILNLRAMLKGEMIQVNTPTILYRISSHNYSIQKSTNILDAKKKELKKMLYHRNLLLFRLEDLDLWVRFHKEPLAPLIRRKIETELKDIDGKIQSYDLYVKIKQGTFIYKIKYLFTPTKIWLHDSFIYRFYNLIKMMGFIKGMLKRQVKQQKIESIQDDRIEILTISDFVDEKRNLF